ncbi:MAG: hypothetical protein DIU66_004250 [Bacillota bacterium]
MTEITGGGFGDIFGGSGHHRDRRAFIVFLILILLLLGDHL